MKCIFKCVNGLASEPVSQAIAKKKYNSKKEPLLERGATFGQSSFPVQGRQIWNKLPLEIKNTN